MQLLSVNTCILKTKQNTDAMTLHAYRYQNDDQSIYFRGYVQWYEGHRRIRLASSQVHPIRSLAIKDAKHLLKTKTPS